MIDKFHDEYIVSCDFCGDELPPEYDWEDAVAAKKAEGWRSIHDPESGTWSDACPDCARKLRYGHSTAASDFAGIGGQ